MGLVSIPYRLATNKLFEEVSHTHYHQFQFLIGWLQTLYRGSDLLANQPVSIPYRLATN